MTRSWAPTWWIKGVEDPFLQSPEAPYDFDAAWRARTFLKAADGSAPERDAIALFVNSAIVRYLGPAPHPCGLPCPLRPPHARSGCAQDPDGRMGADRPGRSPYDVLGLPYPGNGAGESQSVSIGRPGARRKGERPGRPDNRGCRSSRRRGRINSLSSRPTPGRRTLGGRSARRTSSISAAKLKAGRRAPIPRVQAPSRVRNHGPASA